MGKYYPKMSIVSFIRKVNAMQLNQKKKPAHVAGCAKSKIKETAATVS